MGDISTLFHATGRTATQPPQPGFPEGLVLDASGGAERRCVADLAYPAECIGTWEVRCATCGVSVGLTAAGRTDDPRRVVLACGTALSADNALRRAWTDEDASTGADG